MSRPEATRRYVPVIIPDFSSIPVAAIQGRLAEHGYEVIIFPSGRGAVSPVIELAKVGLLAGIIEFVDGSGQDGFGALRLPRLVVPLPSADGLSASEDRGPRVSSDLASRLNDAHAPLVVIVPTKDLSPEDKASLRSFRNKLSAKVQLITIEAEANTSRFANRVADEFLRIVAGPLSSRGEAI